MVTEDIESLVLSRSGDWKFDEDVSKIFDSHVRRSIPCYNQIQELIGLMSKELLPKESIVYDLGTATGEIIRSIHVANPLKKIRYFGIDKSSPMLNQARLKCANIDNVIFLNEEIESHQYQKADLVIAAFTFQFIELKKRLTLLQTIYDVLKPQGSFILCEKIIYENSTDHDFYKNVHETWKYNHFTKIEIEAKKESLKNVMLPMSLDENMRLLYKANFNETNIFFKWGNFACILAKKEPLQDYHS